MKPQLLPIEVRWSLAKPVERWIAELPTQAATAIQEFLGNAPAQGSGTTLEVPAAVVARWSSPVASQLGLPPNCPLTLDIRLSGSMGKPGAQITTRWLQPGRSIPAKGVERTGLWLNWQDQPYRINAPFYDVLELVDAFNACAGSSIDEQFRLWASIRAALGDTGAEKITDGFLKTLRVVTASSLTFAIGTDARGEVQLDPVLLTDRREDGGEDVTQVRALLEADEALFPQRLDQMREGAPAFPLSQGVYVVADEPLRRALAAVKQLRKAPAEQRKRAAMYPEAVIREVMGVGDNEPTVFVETERFAERVRDVGQWSKPALPWIKIESRKWDAPISAGVRIDGVDIPIEPASVKQTIEQLETAIANGIPHVLVAGQEIAANLVNLKALKQLDKALEIKASGDSPGPDDQEMVKNVLIIETNFDEASFSRVKVDRRPGMIGLPHGLRTSPKKHQELGISWLQRHWIEGSRGALLCDDMGLGKTYQALALCLWLREMMEASSLKPGPLLLVAPVGLLRNWEAEIADHLFPPGLGNLVRAYGDHLKGLKRGRHVDGTAGLDTARLGAADVVLANYEAVSDYQLSFGAVTFVAVVLDEAQKVKSPSARMTHAVKALNTNFMLAMTGTPVENRLADLWCIADAVQPGALADLKDFSSRYESEAADVNALRQIVWQEESAALNEAPKILMRRLKTDKLEGLPAKHQHTIPIPMPPRQLEAYQRAVAFKEIAGPQGTLGMIHALRRASLHPMLVTGHNDDELLIEDSARFIGMISVLDRIAPTGERALVFLESLDLQDVRQLPTLLQRRYGLDKPPMVINGTVSSEVRQSRVNAFQKAEGFDVMLLSPKAGGVGLTLTAANHVIHLSRWWNPAVEDQCSDRVYRIGQTKSVHVYYPLAVLPDTPDRSFDMQLQMLMDRKRQLAVNLLAPPAFSQQDYQALITGTRIPQ